MRKIRCSLKRAPTKLVAGGINNSNRFFGRIFIRGRVIDREKTEAYAI